MSRYNTTNNGGLLAISGGNMPASTYSNQFVPLSRTKGQGGQGGKASIVVVANSHAVEVDGDGGLWDTVSNIPVDSNATNINCIGT